MTSFLHLKAKRLDFRTHSVSKHILQENVFGKKNSPTVQINQLFLFITDLLLKMLGTSVFFNVIDFLLTIVLHILNCCCVIEWFIS